MASSSFVKVVKDINLSLSLLGRVASQYTFLQRSYDRIFVKLLLTLNGQVIQCYGPKGIITFAQEKHSSFMCFKESQSYRIHIKIVANYMVQVMVHTISSTFQFKMTFLPLHYFHLSFSNGPFHKVFLPTNVFSVTVFSM